MSALTWSDALALQQPEIDATHREFVDLLAGVEAALAHDAATLGAALASFVQHTEAHFAQEERWLAEIGFGADHCHGKEHRQVLELVHEVQRRLLQEADVAVVRALVPALAQWFPVHAQSMDWGLAQALQAVQALKDGAPAPGAAVINTAAINTA